MDFPTRANNVQTSTIHPTTGRPITLNNKIKLKINKTTGVIKPNNKDFIIEALSNFLINLGANHNKTSITTNVKSKAVAKLDT